MIGVGASEVARHTDEEPGELQNLGSWVKGKAAGYGNELLFGTRVLAVGTKVRRREGMG